MPHRPTTRRGVLAAVAGAGALTLAGATDARVTTDEGAGTDAAGTSREACTPGHTDGDAPCEQVEDDVDVLTGFDAAGTPLPVHFEYPCGWRTSTTDQFDDRAQANASRSDSDLYVDVQVRGYYEPVPDDFLETKREEGSYEELEYEYAGATRTGVVSSRDNAQYGTVGHAVVPFAGANVHVELVSTMHVDECEIAPRPDFWAVREMLASLSPNLETTFPAESEFVERPASVSMDDQVAQDAGTLVVVDSAYLPDGGFVTINDAATLEAGDPVGAIMGQSSYLTAGTELENVRIRIAKALEDSRDVVARVHQDTDGDLNFDYIALDGAEDGPYEHVGGPVGDPARVTVHQPSPSPTASPTATRTPTPTPTRTPTPRPTPTGSPTPPTTTAVPADGETSPEETAADSPGFGAVAALAGLVGSLAIRRYLGAGEE